MEALCSSNYCSTLLAARKLERSKSLLQGLSVAAALAYVLAYSGDPGLLFPLGCAGVVVDYGDPVAEVVLTGGASRVRALSLRIISRRPDSRSGRFRLYYVSLHAAGIVLPPCPCQSRYSRLCC